MSSLHRLHLVARVICLVALVRTIVFAIVLLLLTHMSSSMRQSFVRIFFSLHCSSSELSIQCLSPSQRCELLMHSPEPHLQKAGSQAINSSQALYCCAHRNRSRRRNRSLNPTPEFTALHLNARAIASKIAKFFADWVQPAALIAADGYADVRAAAIVRVDRYVLVQHQREYLHWSCDNGDGSRRRRDRWLDFL